MNPADLFPPMFEWAHWQLPAEAYSLWVKAQFLYHRPTPDYRYMH